MQVFGTLLRQAEGFRGRGGLRGVFFGRIWDVLLSRWSSGGSLSGLRVDLRRGRVGRSWRREVSVRESRGVRGHSIARVSVEVTGRVYRPVSPAFNAGKIEGGKSWNARPRDARIRHRASRSTADRTPRWRGKNGSRWFGKRLRRR